MRHQPVRPAVIPIDKPALTCAPANSTILTVPQSQEPDDSTAQQSPMTAAAPHLVPPDHGPPLQRYPMQGCYAQAANHIATVAATTKLFPLANINTHAANIVVDPITGETQEYRHLIKGLNAEIWCRAFANEIGQLASGVGNRMTSGTKNIVFIRHDQVPVVRKVTYGRIVATIRPHKTKQHCVRLNVGGNFINYLGDVRTPTSDMTTAKLLFNIVVSTPDTKFITCDSIISTLTPQ